MKAGSWKFPALPRVTQRTASLVWPACSWLQTIWFNFFFENCRCSRPSSKIHIFYSMLIEKAKVDSKYVTKSIQQSFHKNTWHGAQRHICKSRLLQRVWQQLVPLIAYVLKIDMLYYQYQTILAYQRAKKNKNLVAVCFDKMWKITPECHTNIF